MMNPRAVVPDSIMPAYPWLAQRPAAADGDIRQKLRALQKLGHPYSQEEIEGAESALEGRTELDAVIAYLQMLGGAYNPGDEP